jgi:hypothetical protein
MILKCSPFKVVYGRDPPALISYQPGASKVVVVEKQLMMRDEFLREIKDRLLQSQVAMKSYEDQKRYAVEFEDDDWVWMRLQQCIVVAITAAHSNLNPKFYGPYKVMKRIGTMAYQLQLRVKIHDVFHVALLKKYEGPVSAQPVPLPDLLHGRVLLTPDTVLQVRLNRGI